MTELLVVDRAGREHRPEAKPGCTLMEILRDADVGIAAVCGGTLSCGTCHVYVDAGPEQIGLALPSEDEAALAEGLTHHVTGRSRLSCQIPIAPLRGRLCVVIAPEE